jgi:1-deoxy-D-xylulose-5-phosphate reductoisomerase
LEFRDIDSKRYPIWEIKDDILKNPHLGVVINASNEIAIERFFNKEISFLDISKMVLKSYEKFSHVLPSSLEDIYEIDSQVRLFSSTLSLK